MEQAQSSFGQRLVDIYFPHLRRLEEERKMRTVQSALERERLFSGQDLSPENLVKFHMAYKDLTGLDPVRGPAPEPKLSDQFLTNEPSSLAQPRGVYGQQMLDTIKKAEAESEGRRRLAQGIYKIGETPETMGAEQLKEEFEKQYPSTFQEAWLTGEGNKQQLVKDYLSQKQASEWSPSHWINAEKYRIIKSYINNPDSVSREELRVASLDENYLSRAMELMRNDLTFFTLTPEKRVEKIMELMETFEAADRALSGGGMPAPTMSPNDPAELFSTLQEMGVEVGPRTGGNVSTIYEDIRRPRRTGGNVSTIYEDIRRPRRNEIVNRNTGIIYKTPSKRRLQ